jgi:hypothetical protein
LINVADWFNKMHTASIDVASVIHLDVLKWSNTGHFRLHGEHSGDYTTRFAS